MGNIKSIKYIGEHQTYDLELAHPDHQFYLANGILTSNSHAVVYSMVSYQTAYLKAHYPVEFLLANLKAEVGSAAPNAKSNIATIKKEIRSNKVKIIPPDINNSQLTYTISNNNSIITGLDALKFVGDDAILDIIEKRPFNDFFDFMVRIDSKKVRANSIQALAAVGALDMFKIPRKTLFLYVSDYRKKLQVWLKKHDPLTETFVYPWVKDPDWTLPEIYALEQFYLGESFTCKPFQAYNNFFKQNDHNFISDIKSSEDKTRFTSIKAIVKDMFECRVKKEKSKYYGQPMIKAIIEDKCGEQCGCTIFPDQWVQAQERIKFINKKGVFEPGLAIHFSGTANEYEDEVGIVINQIYDIALSPPMPSDLKAKKISLKETKAKSTDAITNNLMSLKELSEKIEDSLYDDGLVDLDEEEINSK